MDMAWRNAPQDCGMAKPGGTRGQTARRRCHSVPIHPQRAGKRGGKGTSPCHCQSMGLGLHLLMGRVMGPRRCHQPLSCLVTPIPALQREANHNFRRLRSPLCSLLLLTPPTIHAEEPCLKTWCWWLQRFPAPRLYFSGWFSCGCCANKMLDEAPGCTLTAVLPTAEIHNPLPSGAMGERLVCGMCPRWQNGLQRRTGQGRLEQNGAVTGVSI